jgi:hypothetical protein
MPDLDMAAFGEFLKNCNSVEDLKRGSTEEFIDERVIAEWESAPSQASDASFSVAIADRLIGYIPKLTEPQHFVAAFVAAESLPRGDLRDHVLKLIAERANALLDAPATKGNATVEKYKKPSYKPDMDGLHNYLKSLGVPESRQPELAAKIDAFAKAEITGRTAAPKLSEADLAAFMTPQRVAALTADTPLSRLQIRYEKRLQEIVLPEDKIKDVKQARAANSLAQTYRNLVREQIKAGLKPQPQDKRVTEAQRLSVAFYREQKADHAPRRRGRPSSKVAMNALA